jgi:hypothetical protein
MSMGETRVFALHKFCHSSAGCQTVKELPPAVHMSGGPGTLRRQSLIHGSTGPTTTYEEELQL